jgi:hypothetical protein
VRETHTVEIEATTEGIRVSVNGAEVPRVVRFVCTLNIEPTQTNLEFFDRFGEYVPVSLRESRE